MTTIETLIAERRALANAELDTYSPEHFPGSPKWFDNRKAIDALNAFDGAHPEVLAAIKAERAAAPPPAYVSDSSSHYNRALRGED